MPEFYLLDQDRTHANLPVIEDYPESIEVLDYISGRRIDDVSTPIHMTLAQSSGQFRPDLVTYLLPLFSDKMKNTLTDFGVDNIDYYPVTFRDINKKNEETGYWLSNVVALIECADLENSVVKIKEGRRAKMYRFKSFAIDEVRAAGIPLFRLKEMPQFLIINEALKTHLEKYDFEGIRIVNTKEYPGY